MSNAEIKWLEEPRKLDYPAALAYLNLIYDEQIAATCVRKLRRATMSEFEAKDIFRASNSAFLGISNSHVQKECKHILAGKKLSPILLVRETSNGRVVIADGYHRMCAVYSFDEDAKIPCKII